MDNIVKNEFGINPIYYDYIRRNNGLSATTDIKRDTLILRLKNEISQYKLSFEEKSKSDILIEPDNIEGRQLKRLKRRYIAHVRAYTETQDLKSLENIDKRDFRNWHIDHIVSIRDGFRFNIPIELIGNIKNLRVISRDENFKKGNKSDLQLLNNMLTPIMVQYLISVMLMNYNITLGKKHFKNTLINNHK